jgi:eukaryotic-like serine/threonine-protein kinase
MAFTALVSRERCYSGRAVRCLEENTLFEYVSDGLDAVARDAVAEHAASCESCRRMIAAAADAMPAPATTQAPATSPLPTPSTAQRAATTPRPAGPRVSHAAPTAPPLPETISHELGLEPGRVLAGKYRLLRLLGAGGMGKVHEAVNTWTGRHVAVKELHGSFSSDATAVQRFTLEARSASKIAHPNVVDILDLGVDPETGALFMVQELLTGATLRQRIAERGRLSLDEIMQIVRPALAALVVAHEAGVVHRDLKPDNIFLARDAGGREVTKLIDFGLSKRLREQDGLAITEHGRQLGTPFYMSPEQLRGELDLDERTDVWSIGVVLFEAASGVRPFPGPTYNELVVQILKEPVPQLAAVLPAISPVFATLVERALERDRERRPRASELHDALAELALRPEVLRLPPGNPYRGILPFEADYRGVFFGRASDVTTLAERVRGESFVLVAGDSGVGKSSLVRAGVVPVLVEGGAAVVTLTPGRHPVAALAAAIAPALGQLPAVVADELAAEPAAVGARLQGQLGAVSPSMVRVAGASAPTQLGLSRSPTAAVGSVDRPVVTPEAVEKAAVGQAPTASSPAASSPSLPIPGRVVRQLVVFVDQLEELLTLAEPAEAAATARALAALVDAAPGLHLIATLRSDFLARLSTLPGLGSMVTRALYLLRPLTLQGVREAIVGPARITGLRFESGALVDELVASAGSSGGELPLLQFALAQLWEARDVERGMICAATLASLGGVAGALARHADGVLAQLGPRHLPLARVLLTALVTEEGTRARRTAAELRVVGAGEGDPDAIAAVLEALVQGRLVTVEDGGDEASYQIAHDYLVDGWDTLRGWRGHDVERSVARQRLVRAAAEWERLGRPVDSLWTGRQLAEVAELAPRTLGTVEAAFLAQSRRTARRRRYLRHALVLGVPLFVGLGFASARFSEHRHMKAAIAQHIATSERVLVRAGDLTREVGELRRRAFLAFDGRKPKAEELWSQVLERQGELDAMYALAAEQLEMALALDGSDRDVRRHFAALLHDRAQLAEQTHETRDRDERVQRMLVYDDDGVQRARWNAPARLILESAPTHAAVIAQRYIDDRAGRRLSDPIDLGTPGTGGTGGTVGTGGITPSVLGALVPGSYLITLRIPGRPEVRAPVLLERGEALSLTVPVPAEVPAGYVYVPPGRFLYGSSDNEDMRQTMMNAQPLHRVSTAGYLIARHEVTFGDWIAFLRDLPPAERAKRRPHTPEAPSVHASASIDLTEPSPGRFVLQLQPTERTYTGEPGQPIRYERETAATQDWMRMPVSGISWDDVMAYAGWLERTGRLRGARPCTEHEWERAARGADDRLFPHGNRLGPDDANFAETYGRVSEAFGPDEVGTHPGSDSPFGIADLAGNGWEWVSAVSGTDTVAIRGGGWYHNPLAARSNNREPVEKSLRAITVGLRICGAVAPEDVNGKSVPPAARNEGVR